MMIEVRDLSFSYGKFEALKGLSFHAEEGKITGLLGPNGSGKSTTFKILSTQLKAQSGEAKVGQYSVANSQQKVRELMGVTFQSPSLDPLLTVEENLKIFAGLLGLSSTEKKSRIEVSLKRLGVFDRKNSKVKELSGGLARRVELAKNLIARPKLLLLDEPTTGLDPRARAEFWKVLRELCDQEKMTVLVTTHLMDEAELCDELIFINEGKLAGAGSPEALRKAFGHEILWLSFSQRLPELSEVKALLEPSERVELRDHKYRIESRDPLKVLDRLRERWPGQLESLNWSKPTLGDIYLSKTGKELS